MSRQSRLRRSAAQRLSHHQPVQPSRARVEAAKLPVTRSGHLWLALAMVLALIWVALPKAHAEESERVDAGSGQSALCPGWLNQDMKQLHSSKVLNLCEVIQGRPVLMVNTASHCGFTDQFGDLEQIHERYQSEGLVVIGVASDSFDQEADSEEEAARVCFKNFGVTFTMLAPVPVRGDSAHPVFQELARQAGAPRWNFYKYLISGDGTVVDYWSSMTVPDADDLRQVL